MEQAVAKCKNENTEGIELQKTFTYQKTLGDILKIIEKYSKFYFYQNFI